MANRFVLNETSYFGKRAREELAGEINKRGSKANNLEITNRVIDIKTILEDIREQVQNIE